MRTKYRIGDRVFHTAGGPDDSGTIVEVDIYSLPGREETVVYGVKFDNEERESGPIPLTGGFSALHLRKA